MGRQKWNEGACSVERRKLNKKDYHMDGRFNSWQTTPRPFCNANCQVISCSLKLKRETNLTQFISIQLYLDSTCRILRWHVEAMMYLHILELITKYFQMYLIITPKQFTWNLAGAWDGSLLLLTDSHCHSSSKSLNWVACPSTLLPAHLSVRFRFFLYFRMLRPYQFPLRTRVHVTLTV